jgi:hypothetical protein
MVWTNRAHKLGIFSILWKFLILGEMACGSKEEVFIALAR